MEAGCCGGGCEGSDLGRWLPGLEVDPGNAALLIDLDCETDDLVLVGDSHFSAFESWH